MFKLYFLYAIHFIKVFAVSAFRSISIKKKVKYIKQLKKDILHFRIEELSIFPGFSLNTSPSGERTRFLYITLSRYG